MTRLSEYLFSLFPQKEHLFVCFTGGGGKTTALQILSSYLKESGKSVLLTTTTKFQNPSHYSWKADYCFTSEEEALSFNPEVFKDEGCVVVYGEYYSPEKLSSPSMETLSLLKERFDVVLCEADGSRGLPFKVHSERDPVIPPFTDFVVSIIGADGALKAVKETTFGLENLERPLSPEALADELFLSLLVTDKEGFFKGTEVGKRALLLNRADKCKEEKTNVFLNTKWPSDCAIIYASVQQDLLYSLIQRGKNK